MLIATFIADHRDGFFIVSIAISRQLLTEIIVLSARALPAYSPKDLKKNKKDGICAILPDHADICLPTGVPLIHGLEQRKTYEPFFYRNKFPLGALDFPSLFGLYIKLPFRADHTPYRH